MPLSVAFAQVTLALQRLIEAALASDAGLARIGPPPALTAIAADVDAADGRVNLCFKAALPEPSLRNRVNNTAISYVLHYDLSVYAAQPLAAELMLGALLAAFAANPLLATGDTDSPVAGLSGCAESPRLLCEAQPDAIRPTLRLVVRPVAAVD